MHVDYDEVARELDGATASDLERRWDSLTSRTTETDERVGQLRTSLGELAQEMKHLGDDNRLSIAQLELGCVERKIEATTRRWQTLGMASCLLEDVCGTFERERQPETLREASTFLSQLTNGKYRRIWTPLGTNQLKIDDNDKKALPLEVLSRGTREAVFIALRLSLAAAYARRGVMLPLVLDDVLVNFDGDRAFHAARTLKTFAELGHQVMMFTCHQHIVEIFQEIDVEVREMPAQGAPGRATILVPEIAEALEEEYEEEVEYEEEEYEEEVASEEEPEVEPEPQPVVVAKPEPKPEPKPAPPPPAPVKTKIVYIERAAEPKPEPKPKRPAPNGSSSTSNGSNRSTSSLNGSWKPSTRKRITRRVNHRSGGHGSNKNPVAASPMRKTRSPRSPATNGPTRRPAKCQRTCGTTTDLGRAHSPTSGGKTTAMTTSSNVSRRQTRPSTNTASVRSLSN